MVYWILQQIFCVRFAFGCCFIEGASPWKKEQKSFMRAIALWTVGNADIAAMQHQTMAEIVSAVHRQHRTKLFFHLEGIFALT